MAIEDSLIVIVSTDTGNPVGAGLLVSKNIMVTCAHVVNSALGLAKESSSRPEVGVRFKFHALGPQTFDAHVADHPDAWNPPPASSAKGSDICFLQLVKPTQVKPTQISNSTSLINQRFRAPGYPENFEGDVDIAVGEVLGTDSSGLYMLRSAAVTGTSTVDSRWTIWGQRDRPAGVVYGGFSGAPVEVNQKVVGLITEARERLSQVTAYMIPFAHVSTTLISSFICQAPEDLIREATPEYLRSFATGPIVRETHLITYPIVEAFAQIATQHVEANLLLSKANNLRLAAGPSGPTHPEVPTIKIFVLPNIDQGAVPFWFDCLTRACLMGPRMLAALLLELPDGSLNSAGKADFEALFDVLRTRYASKSS